MDPKLIEGGVGAAALAFNAGMLGLMLLLTRPRSARAQPATQELGPEPPAVVSLLVGGWDLTEDAAESTLIDLGARKLIEFRQPGNDPRQTTVHVLSGDTSGLTPYERRVYNRVTTMAVGGVVPLTALTFRDQGAAKTWWKALRAEVIVDARQRGLSRRRFGPAVVTTMTVVALISALAIAYAVFHFDSRTHGDDPLGAAFGGGFFAFVVLAAYGAQQRGERDTAAGREVAGRWLGVRAWLRGHPAFADLPPASVKVWDRYLSYGDAVGVTRVASAVIDLGMGDRKRVWSSFGGTWHRVRVRYSRAGVKYGATAPRLVLRGAIWMVVGYFLVRFLGRGVSFVSDRTASSFPGGAKSTVDIVSQWLPRVGFLLGLWLLGWGAYILVRVAADLVAPVELTGQVLWKEVCRSTSAGENSPSVPSMYHLPIDDGKGDTTRAWAAPPDLAGRCDIGDTVRIRSRRWSRRILEVTVTEAGHFAASASLLDIPETGSADQLVAQMLGQRTGSALIGASLRAPQVGPLLTPEEVSQALGLAVTRRDTATPGPVEMMQFVTADRGKLVLMCQVTDGLVGQMAWKARSGGQPLPGIADGAFLRGDSAVVRCGETMVVLTLVRAGKGRGGALPQLLGRAAARVPQQRGAPPSADHP